MTGMSTKLHVLAKRLGEYPGMAAEINGKGYSGMRFVTKVVNSTDFNRWAQEVQAISRPLTLSGYNRLSSPSENSPAAYYSAYDKDLYDTIIMKYMPGHRDSMN
jgi:cytochrome o ubiquinol oxidase subunit 2